MRISDKPTDTIIMKARTQSEWDSVEYCVLIIDKGRYNKLQSKLELFNKIHPDIKNQDFLEISFWDYVDYWIKDDIGMESTGLQMNDHIIQSNKDYLFIEVELEELEEYNNPESEIDCVRLNIQSPTSAYFTGSGKYSGEWYESDFFNPQTLLTELKQLYTE